MNDSDIELALIDLSEQDFHQLSNSLPQGYSCLDRTDKGWGLVIRPDSANNMEDIDDSIVDFLNDMGVLKDVIFSSSPILRLGIYNNNYDYTLRLKSFELLSSFNISLEASIYPTDAE